MFRPVLYLVFIPSLFFGLAPISAQQYQCEVYDLSRGLPQSQVQCLIEDSLGGIWLGSAGGGAAHFDGQQFTVVNSSNGLPSNKVNALAHDKHGNLWIGTDNGVASYNGIQVTRYSASRNGPAVYSLFCDNRGSVWAGCEDSLYIYSISKAGYRLAHTFATADPFIDMALDAGGELYACGSRTLYKLALEDGQLRIKAFANRRNIYAEKIFLDHNDKLSVATLGSGVLQLENDSLVSTNKYLPGVVHDGLALDANHSIFATQNEGVIIADNEGITERYNAENGLPVNTIQCLLHDRWNNIWLGSSGGGLVRMSQLPFKHHYTKDGPYAEAVYAIAGAGGPSTFLSLGRRGVFRFDGKECVTDSLLSAISITSKALHIDRKGRLWVGTEGDGVYLRTADTLLHLTGEQGLTGTWIKDFAEGTDGSIWVATAGGGITRFTEFPTKNEEQDLRFNGEAFGSGAGIIDRRITSLAIDPNNVVWYGSTTGGLGYILPSTSGKRRVAYDGTVNSISTAQGLRSKHVSDLALDSSGVLWLGMADGSIANIDTRKAPFTVTYPENESLNSSALYALAVDSEQNLWVGSARGVTRLFLDEKRALTELAHYSETEGFLGREVCSKAIAHGSDGSLWFGSMDGFSVWQGAQSSPRLAAAPVVTLRNPHLFYKPLRDTPQRIFVSSWNLPRDTLVLTYTQNNLSFDISAVHLSFPKGIVYQHYLEGLESEWSPLSTRNSVTYSNLAPGEYTLRARACSKGGSCDEARPVVIRILQPFWMAQWFMNTVIAVAALFLILLFLLALRTVKKRARRRNERLRLERDLLSLEQQTLRLQMNPHFIFNALNSIQGLIAREDQKSARQQLSQFSHLMREILQNSREELISLEDELATLQRYLELMCFTHDGCFTYRFEVEEAAKACLIPPLLLQPFVENAIIHGIIPQGRGEVIVTACLVSAELRQGHRQDAGLQLTVEDNGVGIGHAPSNHGHRSAGLEVTRERLAILGKEVNGRGSASIVPRNDGGTLVTIVVPVIKQ